MIDELEDEGIGPPRNVRRDAHFTRYLSGQSATGLKKLILNICFFAINGKWL